MIIPNFIPWVICITVFVVVFIICARHLGYNPILDRVWIAWRSLFQTVFCGSSRDSYIPNDYYNTYRRKCYITCLKHIAEHQDDVFAMNCATILAVNENMNRFGQNQFGNEALIDEAWMMPRRYGRE